MPYKISPHRSDFNSRTSALKASAYRAHSSKVITADVRDLVYQASILQSSAAIEDYVKSMFDSWAFKTKNLGGLGSAVPMRTRASMARERLAPAFFQFAHTNDEIHLLKRLEGESLLWDLLEGTKVIPAHFDGSSVYRERKYPSPKNINVLFARIGIDGVFGKVSGILKSDAELRLEAFNSLRTALAHAHPPQLTYLDVKRNVENLQGLVRAFDRIAFGVLTQHMGQPAW